MANMNPIPILIVLLLCLTSCGRSPESDLESRIRRVEGGLLIEQSDPPWNRVSLAERMAHHHVPGVSIAVINGDRIEWARGYGFLKAGKNDPVTPETLFQTASPAKIIVAVAALHHVERGLLDLDGDVNRRLVSWHVPENRFTAREKVTLRRLLSHSAGITVGGFRGYARGEAVPSFKQVLDGEPPANSAPIRVDIEPGSRHRYSGGGYLIVKQLLEDVTGRRFPEIMRDTVLEPWGMAASTFETPLPENRWANAARGHRSNGRVIRGGWHTYPEMGSGAAMWSTPSDLARFAIRVMRAYNGRPDPVFSPEMARQMLTPQIADRGLGPSVLDDGGDRFYFLHPGANDGYKSLLVAYPKRGQGVVIMCNGDNGEALRQEILNSVSVEYGLIADRTGLYAGIAAALVVVIAFVGFLLLRRRRQRTC